ncbi:MAG: alpha/beta fold hydrolase, partial [Acidimicrobiales bacterium]
MRPGATHHVNVGDAQVAYQVTGDGPIDLVYMLGVGTNFQMWWDYPPFATLLERLASFSRLILFDRRGSGISDPVPAEGLATWESFTDDLRAVLDAAASTTATIFACHDAGPVAMTFAATHPDRVANLVLWDSFARISADADYPIGRPLVDTDEMASLLEAGWGTEASARYLYGDDIDEELLRWHMKVTLGACTPASYARQNIFFMGADARSALDLINVPVLVLHEAECHVVPPELGRFVAENVPDARYVELPGGAIELCNRPDAAVVLDVVEEFVTGVRPPRQSQRVLACVLFTDIVGSTTRAAELGDDHWTTLLYRHDVVSRTAIAARSGILVKTTGDGVLATFDGPGRAIQAAID